MSKTSRRSTLLLASLLAPVLATSACATDSGDDGTVQALASFYPLQLVTEQVGGDRVEVGSLTPPGAEPHDVELSPAQVASVSAAQLVVYLSGFQPAVDDAVAEAAAEHVVDAETHADLAGDASAHDEHGEGDAHADEETHAGEDTHADDTHTEESHADEEAHADEDAHTDAHGEGATDPHFWLDPTRLAAVADDVAAALTEIDPEGAETYAANAEALGARLTTLDEAYADGLATCERRVVVTSHAAFGYLAARYDLEMVGISGLEPDAEPSPARLREVGDVVTDEGVTTIFFETLVSPKVAQTLAADLGVETAVLDPIEGLADDTTDYFSVAEANLEALRVALSCS